MKVSIEVDIPDGAQLDTWVVSFDYLADDGETYSGCDYSEGMTAKLQIALLISVLDAVRFDQVKKWHQRRDET